MSMSMEQLQRRREFLGASEAAAALGLSEWRTPYDVWATKTDRTNLVDTSNKAMQAGTRLEGVVLDYIEGRVGPIQRNTDQIAMQHPELPWLRATPDAIVIATGEPVEAKTAGITGPLINPDEWGDEGTDNVPLSYLVQCYAQMACTNKDVCHLMALIGNRGPVLYRIPRHREREAQMLDALKVFWRCVESNTPPENTQLSTQVAKLVKRVPNKSVELPVGLIEPVLTIKSEISRLGEVLELAENKLKTALGDAEEGCDADGFSCTLYEQTRVKMIPDYEQPPTVFRVLRGKGPKAKKVKGAKQQ